MAEHVCVRCFGGEHVETPITRSGLYPDQIFWGGYFTNDEEVLDD